MTNDIRLYIGNELVEFDKIPDINYNWQETDFSNPTITKNSYSKTISVKGTKKNNDIFGHFWDLERYQEYGTDKTGVNYNPTYRVPFSLYVDGSLFQKGYVKLQKVKRNGGVISYEIGLFGGLGSFLYNLSTNWAKGTTKTLGDMTYYLSNREVNLDFTINKATVNNAWNNIENDNSVYSILNFAPMYTGIPSNLDGNKVLINFNGISGLTTTKTEDNITYSVFSNSYSIGQLDDKIDMFEAHDLRSYLQTPVIRVKSIIDALCKPINNKGEFDDGYQVVLDGEWFNSNNPFYESAFMTLPQISSLVEATSANYEITDSTIVVQKGDFLNYFTVNYELPEPITETGSHARLVYKLRADVNTRGTNDSPLSMTNRNYDSDGPINAIAAQIYAISNAAGVSDDAETILGGSVINWYTSPSDWEEFVEQDSNTYRPKYQPQYGGITYLKNAKWTYDASTSSLMDYVFNEDNGYIILEMDIPVGTTNIRFNVQRLNKGDDEQTAAELYKDIVSDDYLNKRYDSTLYPYYSEGVLQVTTVDGSSSSSMISGKKITKEKLLSTSYSVADWLMSYCKMFGLYIHKDITEDIIYIDTRNTFYNRDKVEDISNIIDYSKEINIIPTNVDAKFYTLTTTQEETDYTKKYSNTWGSTYGMKKINTGYDFDANSKELLKSSLKGAIDAKKLSLYYLKPITGINPYVYNGFSYTLYEQNQISGNTTQVDVTKRQISNIYQTQHYNNNEPYADFMNRVCLENEQKAAKTENVMVFYCGMKSIDESYGFWITDDMPVMNILNNKSCWIMTGSEVAHNGDSVGISVTHLPRFSRYWETGNDLITYSMDFGSPRELYINSTNDDGATLYSLFYKKYLEDLYDINTKVVELYIKPQYLLSEDNLRSFYWFANSIWRLNKVIDYSPVENRTVKCQFVKIQSLNNMTNEVPSAGPTMTVTLNQYTIGYMGGSINGRVETSDGRNWRYISSDVTGVSVSPTTGNSGGSFVVSIPENTGKVARRITLTFGANEITKTVTIQQEARKLIEISAATPVVAEATTLIYDIVTNPGAIVRTYRHNDLLQTYELIDTKSFEEGMWTGNSVTIPINNTYSAVTYLISGITSDDLLSAQTTVIQSASAQPQSYITISGVNSYAADATRITYSTDCYPAATIYLYGNNGLMAQTSVGSGQTYGLSFNIPANSSYTNSIYYLSGVTTDSQANYRLRIVQAASAATTLVLTAPSPIPAIQTYITYDIISNASTFVDLYKNGVSIATNTHTAGEWRNRTFNIPANTGVSDITYIISAKTADNLQTTSVEVVQKGTTQLVISGSTNTIPYSATTLIYTLKNYPSAKVEIYKNGTRVNYNTYDAGDTRELRYGILQNSSMSAITYLISGMTTDSGATGSFTITQTPNTTVTLTASSPIPAEQTYISYGLTANQSTTIYLIKDGSVVTSVSKTAGSYDDQRFSINANTTYSSITYTLSAVTSDNQGATATVVQNGVPEPEKHLTINAPENIGQSATYIPWTADTYPSATIKFYKDYVEISGGTIQSGITTGSWYVGINQTYSAITYIISGVTTEGNIRSSVVIVQAGADEPKYVKYADDTSAKTDTYTSAAGYELYDLVTNMSLTELNNLTINHGNWNTVSFVQNSGNFFLKVEYDANSSTSNRTDTIDIYSGSTRVLTLSITQSGEDAKYLVLKGGGTTIAATATSLTWGYSANTGFNVYFYKDGAQVSSTTKTAGDVNNITDSIPQNTGLTEITWVISGVNSTYGVSDSISFTQSASASPKYFYWGTTGSATTSGGTAVATARTLTCSYRTSGYSTLGTASTESWITGGTFSNGTFTARFTANTGSSERSGTITVYADGQGVATFTVTQSAPVVENHFYWGFYGTSTTSGGTATSGATSLTCHYRVSGYTLTTGSSESWITSASFNNGTFTANFTTNTGAQRTGTITVYGDGSSVGTFNITQNGAPAPTGYTISVGNVNHGEIICSEGDASLIILKSITIACSGQTYPIDLYNEEIGIGESTIYIVGSTGDTLFTFNSNPNGESITTTLEYTVDGVTNYKTITDTVTISSGNDYDYVPPYIEFKAWS